MVDTLTQPTQPALHDPRVYHNVHFRLNAGDLRGVAPEDHFFPEITALLTQHGFTVTPGDGSGRCPRGSLGAQHLYAHPADLSGYVLEETIAPLQASLAAAQSFRLLALDRYDQAYHYTPEEFDAALVACRDDMAHTILARFRTRKSTQFYSRDRLLTVRSGLEYFHDATHYSREVAFIDTVFAALVDQGHVLSTVHDGLTLYRTR